MDEHRITIHYDVIWMPAPGREDSALYGLIGPDPSIDKREDILTGWDCSCGAWGGDKPSLYAHHKAAQVDGQSVGMVAQRTGI